MKIENGKIVLETKTCWYCEGKGETTVLDSCPLFGKAVNKLPDKKCPHCGAKNRHSHHAINPHTAKCHNCEGTGHYTEDLYGSISAEEWARMVPHFRWSVSRERKHGSTFSESYLGGGGSLYGLIDYGRTSQLTDEQVLKQVPTDTTPGQPIQWVNKDTLEVPPALVIELRPDGYSVVPDWSSKPESQPKHYEANL